MSDNSQSIQNTETIPQLFKMMQNSAFMGFFYQYIIKIIGDKMSNVEFFKNKSNIKYITIAVFLMFATSLVGMLSYFLFYVLFFFSSLKCILWLFEAYIPDTNSDESTLDVTEHYVSESSPVDVLEYYIVPIFIVLVLYPLAYIPIPFVPFMVYGTSVLLSLACMANKSYRQRFCIFIRDLFTNKNNRDENGKYIPGHEGEFHKFLQTICYSIECINTSTFNITHNPRSVYNSLDNANNISQAFSAITSGVNMLSQTVDRSVNRSNGRSIYKKSDHPINALIDNDVNSSATTSIFDDEFDEDL
jgi:hypothetical protein